MLRKNLTNGDLTMITAKLIAAEARMRTPFTDDEPEWQDLPVNNKTKTIGELVTEACGNPGQEILDIPETTGEQPEQPVESENQEYQPELEIEFCFEVSILPGVHFWLCVDDSACWWTGEVMSRDGSVSTMNWPGVENIEPPKGITGQNVRYFSMDDVDRIGNAALCSYFEGVVRNLLMTQVKKA